MTSTLAKKKTENELCTLFYRVTSLKVGAQSSNVCEITGYRKSNIAFIGHLNALC